MESGKVQESGLLTGKRGGFFLLNIDDPVKLYELLGPEIYSTCRVEAQPVTPMEKAGELFQKWAADLILFEWDDLENVRQFGQSDELRQKMQQAGVADRPDFYFLEEFQRLQA